METDRIIPINLEPNGFTFVKKSETHDISFRRVGVNAGAIDKVTLGKSESSHYFIKLNRSFDLNKLKWVFDNTVGPRSISKQELIKQFNLNICLN